MKAVYKYPVAFTDTTKAMVPESSKFLHIADQHGQLYVWCLVDTDDSDELLEIPIYIRGTGHPFTGEEGDYITTIFQGDFVWHIFSSV